jgi:hypothetical protein
MSADPARQPRPLKFYKWLHIKKLFVDSRYQREEIRAEVDQIASDLDWDVCGVLVVSQRADGRYAILDGQQRPAPGRKVEP